MDRSPNHSTPTHPLRVMLFDSPRTTCQVFYKLFQSHPQLAWGRFYHGFNGYQLYSPDRFSAKLQHSETVAKALEEKWVKPYEADPVAKKAYPPILELAQQKYAEAIESSERDGEIFFGKEHILCLLRQDLMLKVLRPVEEGADVPVVKDNPTYIPDDIIKTLSPLFLIRHPLLVIDSSYRGLRKMTGIRPEEEDFEFQCTLKWTKILYEYFKAQLGIDPVVVESEDYIYNTKAIVGKLCAMYGLDPDGVKDTWDPVPEQYWPKGEVAREFVGHVMGSTGLERAEKPPSTDLGEWTSKWEAAYGPEIAAGLRKRVEDELPVYEYLWERRLAP